ncbi:MAG TPA: cytochrome P450 [Solirubrobacteraceae bacterium]|nr:cytochrome P450 [Solirubrobacteraceae bacterium]
MTFGARPMEFNMAPRHRFGDVWQINILSRDEPFVVTCHPDHVESLFKAKFQDAETLTSESPLRPILGPNSILTMIGDRHMRERKLLLPPFHGEAVQRYVEQIAGIAEREIDRWEVGRPFSLARRMQAVTLDVIMSGVFGVDGPPAPGTHEFQMRETFRKLLRMTTRPIWQLVDLQNLRRPEPRGPMRLALKPIDEQLYAAIRARRAAGGLDERADVLSLLLAARDEDGEQLSDRHVRDELMSLVLAGHETTANSLAWTFERLVRSPAAYDRLREIVRSDDEGADDYVEATVYEGMRVRPVIPIVVRKVKRPWQLGEYVVPAQTPVAMSINALHHREDVYPEPFAFRPERFLGDKQQDDPGADRSGEPGTAGEASGRLAVRKPGTYTWIPFGGGVRRCLGAALAMAEQKVVLRAIARRTDLRAASARPERPRQRNVTMIPGRGGRVIVERKLAL